jgi:hypothetical protein
MRRKPWEVAIEYVDDRFPDKPSRTLDNEVGGSINPDPDLVPSRIREILEPTGTAMTERQIRKAHPRQQTSRTPETSATPRPSWRDAGGGRSIDDRPLDYGRGPHDREIDVDDRDDIDA